MVDGKTMLLNNTFAEGIPHIPKVDLTNIYGKAGMRKRMTVTVVAMQKNYKKKIYSNIELPEEEQISEKEVRKKEMKEKEELEKGQVNKREDLEIKK